MSDSIDTVRTILHNAWKKQCQDFGALLYKKRLRTGLSIVEMSKKIGVHYSQLSRWENGETVPAHISTAMAVAECYRLNKEEKNQWYQLVFGFLEFDHKLLIPKDLPEEFFELNSDVINPEEIERDKTHILISLTMDLLLILVDWYNKILGTSKTRFEFKIYKEVGDELRLAVYASPLIHQLKSRGYDESQDLVEFVNSELEKMKNK